MLLSDFPFRQTIYPQLAAWQGVGVLGKLNNAPAVNDPRGTGRRTSSVRVIRPTRLLQGAINH